MTTKTADPNTLGPALLRRLEHILWVRRNFWSESNDRGQRLINRSLWVAFADCHAVGLRREALAILCVK